MSLEDLAPANVRAIMPYVAGKPISETARELGIPEADILKMASNESPLGPSPKAVAATASEGDRGTSGVVCRSVLVREVGDDGLDAAVVVCCRSEAQLEEDVVYMRFDGAEADHELCCDRGVREALGQQG